MGWTQKTLVPNFRDTGTVTESPTCLESGITDSLTCPKSEITGNLACIRSGWWKVNHIYVWPARLTHTAQHDWREATEILLFCPFVEFCSYFLVHLCVFSFKTLLISCYWVLHCSALAAALVYVRPREGSNREVNGELHRTTTIWVLCSYKDSEFRQVGLPVTVMASWKLGTCIFWDRSVQYRSRN